MQTDPSIVAAIISGIIGLFAAILSGIISILGALLSNMYQSRKRELHETRTEIKTWYDDVQRAAYQLRMAVIDIGASTSLEFDSMKLDYENSGQQIQEAEIHIERLEELNVRPPEEVEDKGVSHMIQGLTGRCENPKGGEDLINDALDFKDFVYEKSHDIEQKANEEKSEQLIENRGVFNDLFGS